MRKIFHDDALQELFVRTGYVQVTMPPAETVEHSLSQVATLRPADNFKPVGGLCFEHQCHCSFLDKSATYKRSAFDLIDNVFASHVDRCLNVYRFLSANFYVKPPGTGKFSSGAPK